MDKLFEMEAALKGKRKGGTIENWELRYLGDPIEGTGEICFGHIVNDTDHGNTAGFRTSEVIKHYKEENILETRNTYYTLGEPAEPPPILTKEEQTKKDAEYEAALELLLNFI